MYRMTYDNLAGGKVWLRMKCCIQRHVIGGVGLFLVDTEHAWRFGSWVWAASRVVNRNAKLRLFWILRV